MNPLKFFLGVTGGESPGRSNSDLWRGYEGPEESAWLEFATV